MTRWAENSHPTSRRLSISSRVIPGFIAALDSAIILAAGLISYLWLLAEQSADPGHYGAAISFVWLTTVLLLNFGGLYRFDSIVQPIVFADKVIVAFGTTVLFLLAAAFALKVSAEFSRIWLASFAISACLVTLLCRISAGYAIGRLADRRVFTRYVAIVGVGEQAAELLAHFKETRPRFLSVIGLFSTDSSQTAGELEGYPILGTFEDLLMYARRNEVDDVIVALPWSADHEIMPIVSKLRELPMNVYLAPDVIGFRLQLRPPPDHFGDVSLVEVMGRPLAGWGGVQKAAFDYILGGLLTILCLPLMALIAIAIKLDSPGPALFRQERYGFVNKIFQIYKFRTMKHLAVQERETVQATKDDPRITPVGRFLRRTSLDELPQLFNVLNGTMSLVGPRPHATDHNEAYAQVIRGYFARHRVKPGITGWAQVNGLRGETKRVDEMEDRVRYDIYYTENWSMLFDLKILAMTVVALSTRRNAY